MSPKGAKNVLKVSSEIRGDRPPTKTVVWYGSVDVSCSQVGPIRLLNIARACAWCFHDSSTREYRACSAPASCLASCAVIELGEPETGFDAEAKWAYCASWLSMFCWRSFESVLASVDVEPLVLGPELRDGAETEEEEPEEDTPELLSEFELVAPVLGPAMGDETLLVGAATGSGRAMVAAATPGGGI